MGIAEFFGIGKRGQNQSSLFKKLEVQSVIHECCENKTLATIRIKGHPLEFFSVFLAYRPEKEYIVIDMLAPPLGNSYIQKKGIFTLSFNIGKGRKSFRSRYIGMVGIRERAIKIAWPQQIDSMQKRSYFRVEPPLEAPVSVTVTVKEDSTFSLTATMRDISEGGISFLVTTGKSLPLERSDMLHAVRFNLPKEGDIQCRGIVKTIFRWKEQRFICGVEFLDLTDDAIKKIARYVVSRQKEVIKRLKKVKT